MRFLNTQKTRLWRTISHLAVTAGWLSATLAGSGCQEPSSDAGAHVHRPPGDAPYTIVCTTGMVADIVRQVAGDQAEVIGLFGAVDPHTYEPTARDIERILDADVVFYSGLMLEGPTQKALEAAARRGRLVRAVTDCLKAEPDYLRFPGGNEAHPDPHVWMDVAAWGRCVSAVSRILCDYDPQSRSRYEAKAALYLKELDRLDRYAQDSIASIPPAQRYLVTAHDAFGYFSRAYEIPVRSVQGISTASEAGTNDINQLVDFLASQQVPAVFVESTVNQANLRAVIEGAARRGWAVTVAGELFSDAMGSVGSYEGTYIGMLDHNITNITRALGGEAPLQGLNGRLSGTD
ncbi:MAG: zinc ABC transporter substrate-binding protein [Planctomycetaceae bacterium]|nr:zinc ABC transporter substrate-binding protein [Planctomycetaceae bacterium]